MTGLHPPMKLPSICEANGNVQPWPVLPTLLVYRVEDIYLSY